MKTVLSPQLLETGVQLVAWYLLVHASRAIRVPALSLSPPLCFKDLSTRLHGLLIMYFCLGLGSKSKIESHC